MLLKCKIIKHLILIFFFVIILFDNVMYAESSETKESREILVNRRVLILQFVNATKSADYSYLEESIPDSFSGPLSKTKSFELLSAEAWVNYVNEGKYKLEDAWKVKTAVEAGRLAGADVVVIGKFVAMTDHIEIFSKAIELSSEREMVSRNISVKLDNKMFDSIKSLTEEMSAEMKEKLPPLSQQVITIER